MNGKQVAVVVPTTLLARQHTKTFAERFRGFPVEVGQASRLVSAAELEPGQEGHRRRAASTSWSAPMRCSARRSSSRTSACVVVDEEQHFGVAHKERLKTLRAEVHVLTLTATPIPRTLQLALTGVRDLSIIASPPVDRLAVRTFVSPFDPLVVREALLRERYRGGQSFYVCPRIEDLAEREGVPRQARARGEGRGRARPDAGAGAGRHHVGVLRRQVRRAALDHHHRIRPRHPDRQHADRPPRRHVRAGAALSVARPGGALEDARLCAVHAAGEQEDHRAGRAAAQGAAIARHARRGLPARLARPRHPRRRQSARRGAVRPHQGGRLRALPADAGRGRDVAQGRHRRAGRRPLVAADHHRHAGADPGGLRRRSLGAARALPPARRPRARTRTSRRSAPNWSTASGRCPRRSSTCSRSSPSRRCAAAPMSRRSRPGRRARCCNSATTPSPIPKG